jgi:predicted amidohydrolase YtcJ
MNPFGRMHAAGVRLAFGSDSPITPIDPWAAIRAAAQHHDSAERLSVSAGFSAHTRGGYHAARDQATGELVEGAAASYACWETEGRLEDLALSSSSPRCTQTVVSGRVVFDAD